MCQLSSLYGTGRNRRTSGLGSRYLSPTVSHRNSLEAGNRPLFKLCSLLATFLSLLGGFALGKALIRVSDATFVRKDYDLRCTPFSRNRHSEQKRPRGSSLLSWGATHCSILRLQNASAAARCAGWQNTCQHTWHPLQ